MTKEKRPPSSNYRKPPVEHQFRKGQSGNPSGRPKKRVIRPDVGLGGLGGGISNRFADMALEEATRLVTVREGEKVSKIPAMQALLRTMFSEAAKGDTKASHELLQVIAGAERERTAATLEVLEYVVRYKLDNARIVEQYQREGRDPADIYPHPDDILFDPASGTFAIDGPLTEEEAGARKAFREQALRSYGRYLEVETALKQDPTNIQLRREFKQLKKYDDFLKDDSARSARLEALRISRHAIQPPESDDDAADQ